MLSFLGSPSWKARPDKHLYRKWSVISNNDNLIWWRSNNFSCMNSFDSVLLCNDITSCDGTKQNRTREQQYSRYILIRIKAKKQQHGRFRLVQIQWNCTFNMPKKMSLKKWKYLEERMQPKAMFIDNGEIFHNSKFVLSHNSLHFSAHQFRNNTDRVWSAALTTVIQKWSKKKINGWYS